MNTWRSLPSGGPLTPRIAALRYETFPKKERRKIRLMTMAKVVAEYGVHLDTARKWKLKSKEEFTKKAVDIR